MKNQEQIGAHSWRNIAITITTLAHDGPPDPNSAEAG